MTLCIKKRNTRERDKITFVSSLATIPPAELTHRENWMVHERMARTVDASVEIWPARSRGTLEFPRHVHRLRSNDRSVPPTFLMRPITQLPDTATYPVTRYPLSFLISSRPRSFSPSLTQAPSYTIVIKFFHRVQTRTNDRALFQIPFFRLWFFPDKFIVPLLFRNYPKRHF